MTIEPGQQLLHYRLIEKLGEGGMGVVWKAVDTTLDREVAIKILPEALAAEPDRLGRFEREAKTLAALNHPNIATIHGLHVDGQTVFLAMELVVGEDLSVRLARGAIPVEEALTIIRKIAEALGAAHEKGLVHRDVKPANVVRAADGTIKVLDFGLAKIIGPEPGADGGNSAASPTITSLGTQAGMILGTAAYMSPEQARGHQVDRRADVWAMGVMLYEMLSGKRLFEGGTISDTLAAVLRADPDWDALPVDTPAGIRRLLRRCLTRDPDRRLRDMGDAALEIDEAIAGASDEPDLTSVADDKDRSSGGRRRIGWLLATAAAAAVGTFILTIALREPVGPPPTRRLAITNSGFHASSPVAISPDGSRIAYSPAQEVGRAAIVVRDLDSYTTRTISGLQGGSNPFFSRDGRWLAFATGNGLARVALDGGVPEEVIVASSFDVTGAWLNDDTLVLSRARIDGRAHNGLVTLPIGEHEPRVLTNLERDERLHSRPHVLPEDRGVLFKVRRSTDLAVGYVGVEGGPHRILIDDATTPQYVEATGHLLFYRPSTESVLAVGFDLERAKLVGSPVVVLRDVLRDTEGNGSFEVAGDGTMIYTSSDQQDPMRGNYDVALVDRTGQTERLFEEPGSWAQPRFSPDGRRLLIRRTATPNCDLWTYDLERGALTRVTFSGDNHDPIWHPSGQSITFATEDLEVQRIASRSVDGTGENTVLSEGEFPRQPWTWSADGRLLAFTERHDETGMDIWVLDASSGEETPFLTTTFDEAMPALSPDGRWLAYVSDESGQQEVYVRPYPASGGRVQISNDGGKDPLWSRDGKELFYIQGTQLMSVRVDASGELRAGVPKKLFEGPFIWQRPGNQDVTPDGTHFVMIQGEGNMIGTELRVVLNWFQELRRLAPL